MASLNIPTRGKAGNEGGNNRVTKAVVLVSSTTIPANLLIADGCAL